MNNQKILRFAALIIIVLVVLSGCQGLGGMPKVSPGDFNHTLTEGIFHHGELPVYFWAPSRPVSDTLRIYIEGDGRAWLRSGRPSLDPTPVNRLVHQLMLQDPTPDLAYLAQPCQYVSNDSCNNQVWTFQRYSQRLVETMDKAVSSLKEKGDYQYVEFVGYSGGGTIALLLAAQRSDVAAVRTVAGNLSPRFFNHYHGVSAMPAALNPVAFKRQLSTTPQIHFVGSRDAVVPGVISQHYMEFFTDASCIRIETVPADHQTGWIERWSSLLDKKPLCDR